MKRKFANRSDWKRIKKRKFSVYYHENTFFKGYISHYFMKKVRTPLVVTYSEKDYCIANEGFEWIQYFPLGERYTITTVLNSDKDVVQWYIDICIQHGLSEDGIPWYDDAYIDIVKLPNGAVYVLDEDELVQALNSGEISDLDFNIVIQIKNRLLKEIENETLQLSNFK